MDDYKDLVSSQSFIYFYIIIIFIFSYFLDFFTGPFNSAPQHSTTADEPKTQGRFVAADLLWYEQVSNISQAICALKHTSINYTNK